MFNIKAEYFYFIRRPHPMSTTSPLPVWKLGFYGQWLNKIAKVVKMQNIFYLEQLKIEKMQTNNIHFKKYMI